MPQGAKSLAPDAAPSWGTGWGPDTCPLGGPRQAPCTPAESPLRKRQGPGPGCPLPRRHTQAHSATILLHKTAEEKDKFC